VKTWEDLICQEFGSRKSRRNLKRFVLEKIDTLDFMQTELTANFALYLLRRINLWQGIPSFIVRSVLTRLFQFDPLKNFQASPIEIYFLVARKDLKVLPYSIVSALISTVNPIQFVTVVCPSEIKGEVLEKVEKMAKFSPVQILIETDEEVLQRSNLQSLRFFSSVSKMEILKICITLNSDRNILVIDADTLLLRSRNWLSNETQVSPVAQEYLIGHNIFLNKLLRYPRNSGLGFVTHHGLFRGKIITDLVEKCGGINTLAFAIDNGVKNGWDNSNGFPSEWQLYGEYIVNSLGKNRLIAGSFINLGVTRNLLPLVDSPSYQDSFELVNRIKKCVPKLGSLSLHAYKDV
jgi:hypothetical protein